MNLDLEDLEKQLANAPEAVEAHLHGIGWVTGDSHLRGCLPSPITATAFVVKAREKQR